MLGSGAVAFAGACCLFWFSFCMAVAAGTWRPDPSSDWQRPRYFCFIVRAPVCMLLVLTLLHLGRDGSLSSVVLPFVSMWF